ncbi:MAG TPA: hypothetical protein ENH97_02140 [bacterium]|nr:hypothetical protein [bacterium]
MLRDKRGVTLAGLIVVLIVILAIGFGIYRLLFTTKSLKIKHLEDMYIVTTRSSVERGWAIAADYRGAREKEFVFGQVIDNSTVYTDVGSAESLQRVRIVVNQAPDVAEGEKVNIQAGDRVELTYDGGRKLLVYLPRLTQEDLTLQDWGLYEFELYVAADGSTYYDEKLTQLAQSAP